MNPSVSVVIPTYNYGKFIAEAIEAALRQSVRPLEIIVIDDGSTDDTESVVRTFGGKVRYIRQDNSGVCSARNRGLAESTGEFIAFLDADDIWEPSKLEKQLAKFAEDSEIGLVHCGMREFVSSTGETAAFHLEGGEGWVAEEIALGEKHVIGPGGSIVIRRDVIDAVGDFDPRLTNGEDWEFCYRVARQFKIGFVAEPLVNYRNHDSNAHKNIEAMERSTLIAWSKVFDGSDRSIESLRRRSYGNLHKILAGSYLRQSKYGGFARNVLKSLWFRPSYFAYYLSQLLTRRRNDS